MRRVEPAVQAFLCEARDNLLAYAILSDPKYTAYRWHRYVSRRLEAAVAAGKGRIMIFAPPQHGKQLADDTPMLTRCGWTEHGALQPGDEVVGSDGAWTRIVAVGPPAPQHHRVRFADGTSVDCHEAHLWQVRDRRVSTRQREWSLLTTREMDEAGLWIGERGRRGSRCRFSVMPVRVVGETQYLPVHPYALGAWLGDGTSTRPCLTYPEKDRAVCDEVAKHYPVSAIWTHKDTGVKTANFAGAFQRALRGAGMMGVKHIPQVYFCADIDQRLQLLAGIIDTDGYVSHRTSRVTISAVESPLSDDIATLVRTFGWRATVARYAPRRSSSGIQGRQVVCQITFSPDLAIPCVLPRKSVPGFPVARRATGIVDIERVSESVGRCIQVAANDGIYLAGRALVRTHNSRLVSKILPAWILGKHPDWPIIAASYGIDLAEENGQAVRDQLATPVHAAVFPESRLDGSSTAKTHFKTTDRGLYFGTTIRGGATGFPSKAFIIDDPFKSREEAESERVRESTKTWFTSVVYPRLAEDSLLILMHTRWHEDDLAGWLIREQAQEEWEIINLPAVALENDLLGREVGDALCPERFSAEALERKRIVSGSRDWEALYQQRPVAGTGGFFKRDWLRHYDSLPIQIARPMNRYLLVDPAGSKGKRSDYSAFVVIGLNTDGRYYLLDAVRDRLSLKERAALLIYLHRKWKPLKSGYEKYGKDGDIEHIQGVQEAENYRFDLEPLGGQMSKEDRIERLQPDFENGRWWLPKALPRTLADGSPVDVVERFVNAEYLTFPAGLHDDMLDAVARIYDIGAKFPKPPQAVTRRGAEGASGGFAW